MSWRVLRGIGANLYGQGVTTLVQLGAVPVLLQAWGPALYGRWATLVAGTFLLSLADLGLMVAAGNAATMAAGRGDPVFAAACLHRLSRFVLSVAVGLGVVLAAVLCRPGDGTEGLPPVVAGALGLAALVGLPLGTAELVLRADGRYARGATLSSTIRLLECAGVVAVALRGGGLAAAAVAVLAIRVAGWAVMAAVARRHVSWWPATRLDGGPALAALVRPALAALAIPAALALGLQGTTVAAGLVLPAEAVAVFVTARTLTRALVQVLGLVTHALMPEMARATGQGDARRSARLVRANLLAGALLLVPGWLALVALGPSLLARWAGATLHIEPLAFGLLASAALAHGCWLSAANLLLAVNRQSDFALQAVLVAAASCGLAALLGKGLGLVGVASASLLGECVMVALVLPPQLAAAFGAPRRAEAVGR